MSQRRTRGLRLPHWLLRLLFTGMLKEKPCSHRNLIQVTTPTVHVCQDCVALGDTSRVARAPRAAPCKGATRDTWPELRMCMICGCVGCCDQAKNKHARKHFAQTGHPLVRSIQPGADWMWCYVDEALLAVPKPS